MKYTRVKWIHLSPDYPVCLYSELDDSLWETRKVEIFADGQKSYADHFEAFGTTQLSIEQLPSLEVIASDPQFVPEEITRQDFDVVWADRQQPNSTYILKWREGTWPYFRWFIRGIMPDMSFYGDVTATNSETDFQGGWQFNVQGQFSVSDYAKLVSFIREIEMVGRPIDPDVPFEGLLAKGSIAEPCIVFKYRRGENQVSTGDDPFLGIVEVLGPYVRRFYNGLQGADEVPIQ